MSDPPVSDRDAAGAVETAERLKERVASLPTEPGVYLFHDARGVVLYVGKAQSLRTRVRSYFHRGGDGRLRMEYLVPRIDRVEVIVTTNVKEALLLENELIKKHKPRFNVLLRDDKRYLALRLDPRETYPRFTETRRFERDGAVYFGPYTSGRALRETLEVLQRVFPLRTCADAVFQDYRRRGRPCLEHAVGRCVAPCCGLVTNEAYAELVRGAVWVMRGRTGELVRTLEARMRRAADEERFEEAAALRDRVESIRETVERQATVSTGLADRDVFALARDGLALEVQVLYVRHGKLLGGHAHGFHGVHLDDAEALGAFLTQFYTKGRDLPREVLLPVAVEESSALESVWSERAGHRVRIRVPRRGEARTLVEMAERNAAIALGERTRRERSAEELLRAVQERLRLPAPPSRIECYDVSHHRGALTVASRVVFVDGVACPRDYRRYKLRESDPGDDYGAMREVLRRRLSKIDSDPAPDLLLLDGGKGQLNVARAVAEDLGLHGLALASLAKERDEESPRARVLRHGGTKREKLFVAGVKDPIALAPDSAVLLLLQRVRDESHRFAIRYHRELRSKQGRRSVLDELPGIGPAKRRALLRAFGSLERIRRASPEQLAAVERITQADAVRIHRFFCEEEASQADSPPDEVREAIKGPEGEADPEGHPSDD